MSDSFPEDTGQGDAVEPTDSTAGGIGNESTESSNPYWDAALANVPTEFHSQLTPTFKQWDDNYAKDKEKLAKFEPYSQFVQNNVPIEQINQSMQLAELFRSSPRDVYDYLQNQYNYGAPTPVEPEEPENFDLASEGTYDLTKDPRFIEVANQASFANQRYEQAEQQRITQAMTAEVDTEVKSVTDKYPMLDIADVANFALGQSQNNGKMPNLMAAADQLAKYLPKERASDTAPPSISGNRGGMPSNRPNFGAMTSDERSKFVADAMRASSQD